MLHQLPAALWRSQTCCQASLLADCRGSHKAVRGPGCTFGNPFLSMSYSQAMGIPCAVLSIPPPMGRNGGEAMAAWALGCWLVRLQDKLLKHLKGEECSVYVLVVFQRLVFSGLGRGNQTTQQPATSASHRRDQKSPYKCTCFSACLVSTSGFPERWREPKWVQSGGEDFRVYRQPGLPCKQWAVMVYDALSLTHMALWKPQCE